MNRAERRRATREGKTTDPLAITWYSNAVWAGTGYGTQTKQVVHRLQSAGHHIAIACNWGLQATRMTYDGIPHYPMGVDTWSNDTVEPVFRDWSYQHPDAKPLVVALFDAWPLKGPAWDRMPVAIWTMIDHLPAPPAVLAFLNKPNVTPLAASRFAQQQIERAGIESIYVPMAIDTNLYKPTPTWHNGTTAVTGREMMGFGDEAEDVFIVSAVNANKSGSGVHRKAWGENLLAFSVFAKRHDDVRLYIHTERNGAYGGVNFMPLIESLGIPEHQYRFVNQWAMHNGIPNEAMAAIYSATDVLLAPTLGEGFGLTVAEAGACETPVIVSDFTCQPELISEDSYLVDGQVWWDSHQAAWWQVPNVGQIVEALEAAYRRGRFRSTKQREHIVANFDADTVFEQHWLPALETITAEPDSPPAVVGGPTPATFLRNDDVTPTLSIYVPCYKRPDDLAALMAALADQIDERVEVIVSDDDPDGSGYAPVVTHLGESSARVDYQRRRTNIGGDANLLRGLSVGTAPWVWVMGDDDYPLPGTVARVLEVIEADLVDRIILLSEYAPQDAAGFTGIPAELAEVDPGLLVAATLVSANVVRRSALDFRLANERADSMYANSWANTSCQMVHVLAEPGIVVGFNHVDSFATYSQFDGGLEGVHRIWGDLLKGYGVQNPGEPHFSWNFVSAANRALAR